MISRFRVVAWTRLCWLATAAAALVLIPFDLSVGQAMESEFSSTRIDLGVVVSDLPTSLAFYQDVIGMTRTGGFDLDSDFGRSSGLTGGVPVSVAVLKLDGAEGSTSWKLMTFDGVDTGPPGGHIQDGVGMRYITVFVQDLAPFLERLQRHDVALLGDTPVTLPDGREFALIQDPDGIFIELIAPKAE